MLPSRPSIVSIRDGLPRPSTNDLRNWYDNATERSTLSIALSVSTIALYLLFSLY